MSIIGCDLHSRYQVIAVVDTDTGEMVTRRLEHENGEARTFYAGLPKPPRATDPFATSACANDRVTNFA